MFDSHAHYDDPAFIQDQDELLNHLFNETDITYILTIGCNEETSLNSIHLSEKYEGIFSAIGYHPDYADKLSISFLRSHLQHRKVVAIGEIGLDYHYENISREVQKDCFIKQLQLADELRIPVIVHDREAHGDSLAIISDFPNVRGVFHSYSGSPEMAMQLIKKGWYISFSGVVTFKNAKQAVEVAKLIPSDRFLVETDCPYLAPVPFRGKRNDSEKMKYTIQQLAEIRGETFESIEQQTERNAKELFGIKN